MAELAKVVEPGPGPARDGVVRWRRVGLQALITARYAVDPHQRSVGKLRRRLGFARLSVRPKPPSSDPEAQEAFKKGALSRGTRPCPRPPGRDLVPGWSNAARSTGSVSTAP
jgi:hypothetical protein